MKGANIISAQPWQRKILGDLYRLLTVFFAGLHGFHDTQCGFKIFSAESVEKIFPKCRINGWSFDVEILLMAEKLGYSVKEVPIKWSDSLGSKVKIGGMISAIFDLLRIRWYMI
jgi:dolichyl-phosphate beta-glucosyltransferase